ncbi:hypothetical protein LGH70_18155 [Hymenobacter sp. BT635]|uniref:Uncharacterized protein n=1 Tax=Hymenobacter nitidus TaxID=2880929 RepID=A0ABS8AGG3_9BACT|nr:hypothetical protein [Hymenobacter nitidus]MCB2379526.1 hypothetical protein [Hymenobacter nitidus]
MFKPGTLRIFAILAMLLSVAGLLLSLLLVKQSGSFLLPIISWALMLWASFLGFRLAAYKLYAEEYKKVGIRIYAISLAFIAFLTVGLMLGFVLSLGILGSLWGLKRNYDEWPSTSVEEADADTV